MTEVPKNTGRHQDGRFQKGMSGNPTGRPKGSRNRATIMAEMLLEQEAEVLVRHAIDLAKTGDPTALRLCLERLIAKRSERPIQFKLPHLSEPRDALTALSAILEAVAEGELTANEAKVLVRLVEVHVRAIEVLDLDTRIGVLEERLANGTQA